MHRYCTGELHNYRVIGFGKTFALCQLESLGHPLKKMFLEAFDPPPLVQRTPQRGDSFFFWGGGFFFVIHPSALFFLQVSTFFSSTFFLFSWF